MRGRRRLGRLEELPRRELLQTLAHHYHHLQNEHKRAAPEGGVRRRIEKRLLEVRARFDRLLDEWVPEHDLRDRWWRHLHYRAPMPQGPPAIRPLVFRGRSEARAVVEIRRRGDGVLDVEVDGSLVERISAEKELAIVSPPLRFRLDRIEFRETFGASAHALQALADFLSPGHPPPWGHVAELLDDGLIDTKVALTPRGRRALALRRI